jgi:aminoglycoside 2''-phosphotransferase
MLFQAFAEEIFRGVPELRGAAIRALGEGMDNWAFLVGDAFVFRFAKHPEAGRRLEREVALLPRLAPRLNLPIPRIKYVGPRSESGLSFVGHRIFRGVRLPAELSGATRARAARDIAEFLAELGAVPVDEARAWGVPEDDPRPGYAEDLARARSEIYPLVERFVGDYVERLSETYFTAVALLDYEPVLLHADLAPDHIRFSIEERRIAGIIDWGDASIGDPDYELSYLYRAAGASFVEEVVRQGPPRDPAKPEQKLRFFAGHDTIDTLLMALERDHAPLVEAALAALREDAAVESHP